MSTKWCSAAICVLSILQSGCQSAPNNPVETDVLRDQPGFVGSIIGAEVKDVYNSENGDYRVVDVEVPEPYVDGRDIQVIDSDTTAKKLGARVELLNDYEGDKVGVRIRIPRNNNITFRLRFIDPDQQD